MTQEITPIFPQLVLLFTSLAVSFTILPNMIITTSRGNSHIFSLQGVDNWSSTIIALSSDRRIGKIERLRKRRSLPSIFRIVSCPEERFYSIIFSALSRFLSIGGICLCLTAFGEVSAEEVMSDGVRVKNAEPLAYLCDAQLSWGEKVS